MEIQGPIIGLETGLDSRWAQMGPGPNGPKSDHGPMGPIGTRVPPAARVEIQSEGGGGGSFKNFSPNCFRFKPDQGSKNKSRVGPKIDPVLVHGSSGSQKSILAPVRTGSQGLTRVNRELPQATGSGSVRCLPDQKGD